MRSLALALGACRVVDVGLPATVRVRESNRGTQVWFLDGRRALAGRLAAD